MDETEDDTACLVNDFDISVAVLPIVKRSTVFNTKSFIKSHHKAVPVPYPNLIFHLRKKDTSNPNQEYVFYVGQTMRPLSSHDFCHFPGRWLAALRCGGGKERGQSFCRYIVPLATRDLDLDSGARRFRRFWPVGTRALERVPRRSPPRDVIGREGPRYPHARFVLHHHSVLTLSSPCLWEKRSKKERLFIGRWGHVLAWNWVMMFVRLRRINPWFEYYELVLHWLNEVEKLGGKLSLFENCYYSASQWIWHGKQQQHICNPRWFRVGETEKQNGKTARS